MDRGLQGKVLSLSQTVLRTNPSSGNTTLPALIHRAQHIELKGVTIESSHHPAQLSAPHLPFNLPPIHIRCVGEVPHGINQSRREDQRGRILTRQEQPRNAESTGERSNKDARTLSFYTLTAWLRTFHRPSTNWIRISPNSFGLPTTG
jgi:hypothetical protein